jgi:PIN domain
MFTRTKLMKPDQIPTVAEHMQSWSTDLERSLQTWLLANGEVLDDRRDNFGPVAFITAHPYRWPALSTEAKRTQSRLLDEYRRYSELLTILLQGHPDQALAQLREDIDFLVDLIQRENSSLSTASKHVDKAAAAFGRHLKQLGDLYSGAGATIVVPDTNALYWNPALENWRAPDNKPFTVILTPTIVSEIDAHKSDSRNSSRRAKAERIVRQISEYRRRGRLVDGVTLVKGVSSISAIAVEPAMKSGPSWLDPSSPDDRFLASAIEIMRTNTRAPFVVVTRDINLQNKLEFARLPFLDPSAFVPEASAIE